MIQLLIEHNGMVFSPPVLEGMSWSTERKGSPGQLDFKVIKGAVEDFTEGDAVRLTVNGVGLFYGFIFKKKRNKDDTISVTAYDQLRYLKNKDTYVYENKTVGQLIRMIASDFNLQTGALEDTGFSIPSRVEENTSLFDMIQNALDLTLETTKNLYVLYDDFGRITLKSLGSMRVDCVISEASAEDFDYESSIDNDTYDKIKLTYDNEETGKREVYIAQDSSHINQWGVLQYFETLQKGEDGKAKADALLSLYNSKTRTLTIKNAFGDVRVRAGSLIPVILSLGDVVLQNYMLVEKCKHEFSENLHQMTLTLRGSEFIA